MKQHKAHLKQASIISMSTSAFKEGQEWEAPVLAEYTTTEAKEKAGE